MQFDGDWNVAGFMLTKISIEKVAFWIRWSHNLLLEKYL